MKTKTNQNQKPTMSNTIGRAGFVLGKALWQNLELSSSWHESVGKNSGAEWSVCPLGEAEEFLVG